MSLEHFVTTYGYWAILVGCFFEGGTLLVIAGFLVRRGYLEWPGVLLVAFLSSWAGDQLYFTLGRRFGPQILARFPKWQAASERLQGLILRFRSLVLFGFRFIVGFRILTPVVMGMGPIPGGQFTAYNAVGAALWTATITSVGYLFGLASQAVLGQVKEYELAILLGLLALGSIFALIHSLVERKHRKATTGR